jgi:hypothetical protein
MRRIYASDGNGTFWKLSPKSTIPVWTNKSQSRTFQWVHGYQETFRINRPSPKPGLVISVHSGTLCKNGLIASIPLFYVSLTDKGGKAGVHPYNRILART